MRIAMWSAPRTVSTALMRSFENRPDTVVAHERLERMSSWRTAASADLIAAGVVEHDLERTHGRGIADAADDHGLLDRQSENFTGTEGAAQGEATCQVIGWTAVPGY